MPLGAFLFDLRRRARQIGALKAGEERAEEGAVFFYARLHSTSAQRRYVIEARQRGSKWH